jgi:hypothetical protein
VKTQNPVELELCKAIFSDEPDTTTLNERLKLILNYRASIRAEAFRDDYRMDELDAVMHSVDKWLDEASMKDNPATRASTAREIALKAIEQAYENGRAKALREIGAESARLKETLNWYADRNNYHGDGSMVRVGTKLVDFKPVLADNGGRARAELGKV